MATGVALSEMLLMLRGELLQSVNPAHGVNIAPAYKQVLGRVQRTLWMDFDWAHLRVDRDVAMAENQRYYDLPSDMELWRIERVGVKWSGKWRRVDRGIDSTLLNAYDSDLETRADPVLRWAPYGNGQFEVWPVPTTDGLQTIRFRGIRSLGSLVNDNDTCDLDADLIVLVAAAELADAKSQRAQVLAGRAKRLLDKLTTRGEHNDSRVFVLGECEADKRPDPRTHVAVVSSPGEIMEWG